MPDFEVVKRFVIRVDDPYATQDQVRAAFQSVAGRSATVSYLDAGGTVTGLGYTVLQTNDVAVRKVPGRE